MNYKGGLVISLDFELLWGVFDKVDYSANRENFLRTRRIIPEILQLFGEYGIHCTWATVGMLFNKNWNEWNDHFPGELPQYENKILSAYHFGRRNQKEETEELCFAPSLIQKISETPNQEIGTHTYSHYYCLEPGQTLKTFKADLLKAIELAKQYNISLKSLVFPRNQFNKDYLKICFELGIENVRSNPSNWYWKNTQQDSLKLKLFRTGDAYVGFKDKAYELGHQKKEHEKPLEQRASRLLRPYSSNRLLNVMKIERIKSEMTVAARNNQIYHLWWHPHNFGNNPKENLNDLKLILEHFKLCQGKFGFMSLNMRDVNKLVSKE